MENGKINFICIIIGIVIGGLSVYMITKPQYEKKYEVLLEESVQAETELFGDALNLMNQTLTDKNARNIDCSVMSDSEVKEQCILTNKLKTRNP